MDNNDIRITPEGVVFKRVDTQEAYDVREFHNTEVFELHPDGTESLIESEEGFNKATDYGIEIGEISTDIAKSILEHNGYAMTTLWSHSDITDHYNCPQEEAVEIIESIVHSEYNIGEANGEIAIEVESRGYLKKPTEEDGWICTDPDNNQHRKITDEDLVSGNAFIFWQNNEQKEIKIDEYSQSEIDDCMSSFGYHKNDINMFYDEEGHRVNNCIIAECLFEQKLI